MVPGAERIHYSVLPLGEGDTVGGGRQMAVREGAKEKRSVEVPALPEQTELTGAKPAPMARLRLKGGELEVYAGAEEAVLAVLVRVLKDAE